MLEDIVQLKNLHIRRSFGETEILKRLEWLRFDSFASSGQTNDQIRENSLIDEMLVI